MQYCNQQIDLITAGLQKNNVLQNILPTGIKYIESKLFESKYRGRFSLPRRLTNEQLINLHCQEMADIQKDYQERTKKSFKKLRENLRTSIEADVLFGRDIPSMSHSIDFPNKEMCAICGTYIVRASKHCLLYTSPSPRDKRQSRMPSSA